MATLRLVLGDQLTRSLASLRDVDHENDLILLAEVGQEAGYVDHHKKKIAFIFSAMRHFAQALEDEGLPVRYTRIDDPSNANTLLGEVQRANNDCGPFERLVLVEPGEFRLMQEFRSWRETLDLDVEIRRDDRFIATLDRFNDWAAGRKRLTMEYFYREMRKDTGILMDGDAPCGGEWNFDKENRETLPDDVALPERLSVEPDTITRDVLEIVAERFGGHFGELEPFGYAVTSQDAERQLDWFIETALPDFGRYQDAMAAGEAFLFHSLLSLYMNAGLLDPLKVCKRAEQAYRAGNAPINAAEGFVRQILGWREFVRGIYWRFMPDYLKSNHLNASRALPDFYWSADSGMACIDDCVSTTRKHAYAHHIQRLMVTGNFALLAGIDPGAINAWYLGVYADAYEWVEAPNTHGMAIFADGGIMATKPYAASGSYINKMSNYCKRCAYKVSKKTGEGACPFNYLYWNFLIENREQLRGNHRLAMIYKTLDRMDENKVETIQSDSRRFLKSIGLEP
jgi:deoxyribodipyrimidine photolyase-related protein